MINVDDLIGVRYRDFGRDPKYGLDCLGLAIIVEKRFGHILPDVNEAHLRREKRNPVKVRNEIEEQAEKYEKVDKPEKEGDLILFNDNGILGHTGVYLGNDMFIHCNIKGVHIERLSSYKEPIGRVYRWL